MSALAHIDFGRGLAGANQSHPHDHGNDEHESAHHDSDLMAGLWQEAPFARLPDDAPLELHEYVQDLENPRHVYAVYRASRRHETQLLVDRYIYQLRVGCGSSHCITPTCFTCRKRLAGKSPIRRYSPTSARTLAVFLASQDHPDKGICPLLRRSNDPPPAANNLIFSAPLGRPQLPAEPSSSPKRIGASDLFESKKMRASSTRRCQVSEADLRRTKQDDNVRRQRDAQSEAQIERKTPRGTTGRLPKLRVTEKPACRDYRSFAATMFETAAFKMLEWLTPEGLQAISSQYSDSCNTDKPARSGGGYKAEASDSADDRDLTRAKTEFSKHETLSKSLQAVPSPEVEEDASKVQESTRPDEQVVARDSSRRKHNSQGSIKSSNVPRPQRKTSLDGPVGLMPSTTTDASRPPKANTFRGDKKPHPIRLNNSIISRAVPEKPLKPGFFENVLCLSPPSVDEVDTLLLNLEDHSSRSAVTAPKSRGTKSTSEDHEHTKPVLDPSWVDYPLPQALSHLNVDLIDFICDTFQEDGTHEIGLFGPQTMSEVHPKPQNKTARLIRTPRTNKEAPAVPIGQWKAFNEQTLFSVMSNPHALVKSFTKDGRLYDSQTIWYCMLRMIRVAPSLVFHSLWLAAKSLFVPPQALKSGRLPSKKLFGDDRGLSNFEAGCVMSICLHALVAAAPCAPDSKTLYEMSRVRSSGLVLAGQGGGARQLPVMCLEYDDVFSNELALRLARRIFCAVTARQCFAKIASSDVGVTNIMGDADSNGLALLLNQLDLIGRGPDRILTFSHTERLLHETRVPTLLLDWARAVLLQEWNGRPEYSVEGPFHGAISLISTLYDNRNMLLLGDIQFPVDYLSDRLDVMEVPVSWVTFNSSRQMHHILDHPYLFSPETLVSFFRSINFSRMSRTFEESSSLKTRMAAIVDPGSLVTNTRHKHVLQDMLKTASSRYLVLSISRNHVLRDAFDQLWRRQERELLRPLKIHLGEGRGGEQGFDSGGVQQEFFRMAIAECLDPEYGAFTVDDRTRMAWFVPGSLVEEWKFEMIGLLMSLAVYNGLTLPITFPKAFYRKLLGQPVEELYHIADGWPELANGLTALQEWDEEHGLVEDIFARTYEFSVPAFGGDVTLSMTKGNSFWPQGIPKPPGKSSVAAAAESDAPLVTIENRDEYVCDYIRYLTDISIEPQFRAFQRGFKACLEPKSLGLLTPSILQSLVEGIQEIDILELRRHARYVGWESSHHTVKDFWSIVRRYNDTMKRKLLEFVTASDRVPVGGIKNVQFVIQKNGEEEGEGGHLPTAYTCYGTLLLPEYKDREVLRERLGMALENSQGFGFA